MPERIAVIGAGLMGHGIAQVFAEAGHEVDVHDPIPAALADVRERVAANLEQLGRDASAAGRIATHASLPDAVAQADVVFEAAPEKLALKQAIFAELEVLAPHHAILATNTSVIPVGEVAALLHDATRAVGTHWWNPPYLVPLVEVVQAEATAPATVDAMLGLLGRAGKQPVHVRRDVPGFVGNRLQHALWREAFALVADGVCDAETVDRVVRLSFGRRLAVMGPIETADYVGLDLTLDIHRQLLHDLDRTPGPSAHLEELVERGDLGMKTGRGFRGWDADHRDRAREVLLRHLRDAAPDTVWQAAS